MDTQKFTVCPLSGRAWVKPVTLRAGRGVVYDREALLEYISSYHSDPLTGEKATVSDIIALKFHMTEGAEKSVEYESWEPSQFQCAALHKPFTKHSTIVYVRPTGNVYSYDAVKELNMKAANWFDILDGTPLTIRDVVVLQEGTLALTEKVKSKLPANLDEFDFVKSNNRSIAEPTSVTNSIATVDDKIVSVEAVTKKRKNIEEDNAPTKSGIISYNNNEIFGPLESSTRKIRLQLEYKQNPIMRIVLRKIGYVDIELYCDKAPRTCYNFMMLAKTGYYNSTKFHRLIKGFMIQGGDPTGTGMGGNSIWGKDFEDEFHPELSHTEKGILSMANRGPTTNSSQFFITFKKCKHLDNTHTVFGKVIDSVMGIEENIEESDKYAVLDFLEKIPTNNDDRPLADVEIVSTKLLNPESDPFVNGIKLANKRKEALQLRELKKKRTELFGGKPSKGTTSIGKYLGAPKF